MNNTTIFLGTFVFILILIAWVISEIISSKETKTKNKFTKQITELKKENEKLTKLIVKETSRSDQLQEKCDTIKDFKEKISVLRKDYNALNDQHDRTTDGVVKLREKVSSKKYSSNSLAQEVLFLLDEYCPTPSEQEIQKMDESREAFTRIKSAMKMAQLPQQ